MHRIKNHTEKEKLAPGILSHDVQDETIFLMFVELNRFRKPLGMCSSLIDKWCFALKKGREEGLREGQYKIARAMKVKGLPNSMIAELTGLSEPEIDSL